MNIEQIKNLKLTFDAFEVRAGKELTTIEMLKGNRVHIVLHTKGELQELKQAIEQIESFNFGSE